MRFLQLFLLVSLILSKVIYSAFWQLNFYLNQKEIAAIECENKDRPEMNCNGKCYLAKQLKKADEDLASKKEKQEQHSISFSKIIEGSLFVPNQFFKINLDYVFVLKEKSLFNYNRFYNSRSCDAIFHPPTIV